MGALEYKPTMFDDEDKSEEIHVDALAELADEAEVRDDFAAAISRRLSQPGDSGAWVLSASSRIT